MAKYINKNEFINDKQLKESILLKSAVFNVAEPHKLDDYLKEMLEENHKQFWNNSVEKLQEKTTNSEIILNIWYIPR